MTDEQMIAKEEILSKIEDAIKKQEEGQLIMVEGEAGSGKQYL
ncbi:hypothetical protein [Staphylococcus gallinarum]|nr:hypothetical protein [Staphylococcus gallinarum]